MLRRTAILERNFERVRVVIWQSGDGEDAV
jgi:hypothetical protein